MADHGRLRPDNNKPGAAQINRNVVSSVIKGSIAPRWSNNDVYENQVS